MAAWLPRLCDHFSQDGITIALCGRISMGDANKGEYSMKNSAARRRIEETFCARNARLYSSVNPLYLSAWFSLPGRPYDMGDFSSSVLPDQDVRAMLAASFWLPIENSRKIEDVAHKDDIFRQGHQLFSFEFYSLHISEMLEMLLDPIMD